MENIQFQDYLSINQILFEWADSIDKKDWNRLHKILAPTLLVDYSIVGQQCFPELSATDFISNMSSTDLVGDPLVRTQHLVGASSYEWVSDIEITAIHQMRAAHQRYSESDPATALHQGHGHGNVKHWYKKIDGIWKLAGVRPEMYWVEGDLSKIFQGRKANQ